MGYHHGSAAGAGERHCDAFRDLGAEANGGDAGGVNSFAVLSSPWISDTVERRIREIVCTFKASQKRVVPFAYRPGANDARGSMGALNAAYCEHYRVCSYKAILAGSQGRQSPY